MQPVPKNIYCTLNQNLMLASKLEGVPLVPQNQPLVHDEKTVKEQHNRRILNINIFFY